MQYFILNTTNAEDTSQTHFSALMDASTVSGQLFSGIKEVDPEIRSAVVNERVLTSYSSSLVSCLQLFSVALDISSSLWWKGWYFASAESLSWQLEQNYHRFLFSSPQFEPSL